MLKQWILWILTTQILLSSIFEWHILPTQANQGCPDQPCRCGDYCFSGKIMTCTGCNPVCHEQCCTGPGPDECLQCSGQCNIATTTTTQTKTWTGSTVTSKIFQALSTSSVGSANQNTVVIVTHLNTLASGSTSTVNNQSTTNSTSGSSVNSDENGLTLGLGVSAGLAGFGVLATLTCKFALGNKQQEKGK